MMWLRLLLPALEPFFPHIFAVVFGGWLAFQAAGLWYGWQLKNLEEKRQAGIAAAISAEQEACRKNQAITSEVSNELQKKLQMADARHADAIRQLLAHEAAKLQAAPGAAVGYDATASGDGLPGTNKSAALSVINGGRAAERQTEQLIACQSFIRKAWEINGGK
jgi:hypothetical protein